MIINKEAILKGPDYDTRVEYHHNTDKRLRFDNQWVVGDCFNLSTGKKIKETTYRYTDVVLNKFVWTQTFDPYI